MGNISGKAKAKDVKDMTTQEIEDMNKLRKADLLAMKPTADKLLERQKALDEYEELNVEENNIIMGIATKPKPAPLITPQGNVLNSSSATTSLRDSANFFANAAGNLGAESTKATRSRDFDGKLVSTYDTKNMSRNIENSTPFRRMCAPDRWTKYLTADQIVLDTAKVFEVVKLYARMFETSSGRTSFPPDVDKWMSVSVYNQMKEVPVFSTAELFSKFCSFNFSMDGGKTLSMRSFLPKESMSLEWSIPRVITALFNLQSAMTAVFGTAWSTAFNLVISECTSGEANRVYGDQVGFLIYSFENQLCRAGQILTEAWTRTMADYYKVGSLGDTAAVVQLVVQIIGEADLTPPAFLSWSLRQTANAKTKSVNNNKSIKEKASSATTVNNQGEESPGVNNKRKKLNSKDRRAAKVAKTGAATATPTVKDSPKPVPEKKRVNFSDPVRTQRICFNNVLHQLGVEGHGHDRCTRPNCANLHDLDTSRKADYVSLASSVAFNVPADVRLLCETAARAL